MMASDENFDDEKVREMQMALASLLGVLMIAEDKSDGDGGPVLPPPLYVPKEEQSRLLMLKVIQHMIEFMVEEFDVPKEVVQNIRTDVVEWCKRNESVEEKLSEVTKLLLGSKEVVDKDGGEDYSLDVSELPDTPRFRRYRDN